jgi:hypothetical protein
MTRSYSKFVRRLEEIGLHAEVEKRALKLHVSLRDLYEGRDRAPSIGAARRAVYTWLINEGKGLNEIARLFDRAPSGVSKLTNNRGAA